MSEDILSPEEPKFKREQVVDAFKAFTKKGFTNPDDLPLDDTDVISANALLQVWSNQRQLEARRIGTLKAELEFTLERTTIYFDAGFSDPPYLDEVAHDWLAQDLQAAEDAGLNDVATRIQAKIDEIEAKLKQVRQA